MYERRPDSSARVAEEDGAVAYFAGGLYGGETPRLARMVRRSLFERDLARGPPHPTPRRHSPSREPVLECS